MMPKLHSTNFPGMELIRPLYLIREDDIKAWRDANELHFIQCACHFTDTCTTCSNQETRSKRQEIKDLIRTLKQRNPDVEAQISPPWRNCDPPPHWLEGQRKKNPPPPTPRKEETSRRGLNSPGLSHHRAYRSVHGGSIA